MRRTALLTSLLVGISLAPGPAGAQYTLTGRLELPGGKPAAGVEVELVAETNAYDFGKLVLGGRHYPEPAARTLTRPDGGFDLEASEAGMWHLYVAPAGYRPMELHLLVFRDRRLPTLELIAETPVTVRLRGADGEPLAGAHVRAEAPPRPRDWRGGSDGWRPAYRQAFTDAGGRAEIGRGADEALRLYAIAAGHVEAERDGVKAQSVDLRLEAAKPRRVKVQDAAGRPVAEALVRLGERRWPMGLTDADGLTELPLPVEGEPPVHVIGPLGERLETRFDLGARNDEELLTLTLRPARQQSGTIVDRETRRPISGAFAWVSGHAADVVRTDSTGTFTLTMPGDSKVWIWAAAEGYLKEYAQIDPDAEGARLPSATTLALQAAIRVRGIVVDESDRPVADAAVMPMVSPKSRANQTAWRASRSLEPAVSDPNGAFQVDNLHPEAGYVLRASKPGHAPTELELPDPRADSEGGVRIVLEGGRVATGVVVSSTGEPIAGARVELDKTIRSGPMQRVIRARAFGREDVAEAFTDEAGRFVIRDLAAASYDLEATASGYAPTSIISLRIPADTGETDLGEIALEPGAVIEGRVTDSRGSAVEGAQVFAAGAVDDFRFMLTRGEEETEPAAVSDANGFFSVPDRRAGERFDLSVKKAGYARASVLGVEAPTYQPVAVKLNRTSKIRGEVVDAEGRPIDGAWVWVQVVVTRGTASSSYPGTRATTDENGRFVVDDVDPGPIELNVMAEGYRDSELESLVVEPERDLDNVRVVLQPGATVTGRVTDAAGRPVSSAMVMLSETGGSYSVSSVYSSGQTDGDGRYRLEGVAPGRQTVTARHDDYQPATREIEVELGPNTLDLTFEGGATISGRVVDESGEPVTGAHVFLATTAMMRWAGQDDVSDTTGAFSIGGVADGSYRLEASREGFGTAVLENLEVGPGGVSGLEIRMSPGSAIVGRLLGLEPPELSSVQVMAIQPPGSVYMGRADREGNYRIDDLGPGEYDVHAQVGLRSRMAQAKTTVVEGVAETLLDLEFESGLTLTGVVLRGGDPLGGVMVVAAGTDVDSHSMGTTTSEGRFDLGGLKPGRHILNVSNFQAGLSHREELELASDLDIVVRVESAVISGSVLDATDSRPLAGASIRLESLDQPTALGGFDMPATTTTDSAGYFRFSQASAGTHRLMAQKDGYAPAETNVVVIDGLDQEGLELLLEPTAGLRVWVTLPSGQPATEFFANVVDAAGKSILAGIYSAGSEGAHLSIPPGSWELLVSAGDTGVSSTPVSLPSDPIAIALREQAMLEIRVPELEGESGMAVVRLRRPDGRLFRRVQWVYTRAEWPVADGKASVPGLEPGIWTVTVEAPDGRRWQAQVSLAAGRNPELVLQ